MAFDPDISLYWEGIEIRASGIFFNWNYLEGTSAVSGDARQLLYALNNEFYSNYSLLPTGSGSDEMTCLRSQTFASDTTLTRRYTLSFNLGFSGQYEVNPE